MSNHHMHPSAPFPRRHPRFTAAAATLCLVAIPRPALANHGLSALGDLFGVTLKVVGGMTLTSLILAGSRLSARHAWVRVLSFLLMLPVMIGTVISLACGWLPGAFAGFAVSLIFGFFTYKGIPPQRKA